MQDTEITVSNRNTGSHPIWRENSATFLRNFLGTSGITTVVTGVSLVVLTLYRLYNPEIIVANNPLLRALSVAFTLSFLVCYLLNGVCWIMVALNDRLWKSTS